MMFCRNCNGRVFVDRSFSTAVRLELFCLMCGRRWFVRKDGNAFGEWLAEVERKYERNFGISS